MADLLWGDPPPDARFKHDWENIASQLRSHPREWALVLTSVTGTHAMDIRAGRMKQFRPRGAFEVATRKAVPGKVDVYVRFVGEVA